MRTHIPNPLNPGRRPHMSARRYLLALTTLTLLVWPSTLASAQGAGFVQLIGNLTRDVTVNAGEVVEQTVLVQNTGTEAAYVTLSFTEATFNQIGNAVQSREPHPRSNKSWMQPPNEPVLIPGGATVAVPFTINPPLDATGGYWSSIIVRPDHSVYQTWDLDGEATVPIQVVAQYAGVIYTNVQGTGSNKIVFPSATVESAGTSRTLTLDVLNEGDRADRFTIRAQLITPQGEIVSNQNARMRAIPGHTRQVSIDLGTHAPGQYLLLITADANQPQLFARQFQVNLP